MPGRCPPCQAAGRHGCGKTAARGTGAARTARSRAAARERRENSPQPRRPARGRLVAVLPFLDVQTGPAGVEAAAEQQQEGREAPRRTSHAEHRSTSLPRAAAAPALKGGVETPAMGWDRAGRLRSALRARPRGERLERLWRCEGVVSSAAGCEAAALRRAGVPSGLPGQGARPPAPLCKQV